jgi:Flp pilus assembly protein TadD
MVVAMKFGTARAAAFSALVLIAAVAWSGCAARKSGLAGRFVKPGEPTVHFGDAIEPPKDDSLASYARRLRELQAKATPKKSLLPTIESTNPELAAALVRLAMQETAENHRLVASAYRNAGVNDYAHRHLQRALRVDPCDAAAFEGLARLWRDWGQPQLALGDVYRAMHCNPNSASLYNTLGTVFEALGQHEHARTAFERALQVDRTAVYAMNNLCYVSLQTGDTGAAKRFCEGALAIDPGMAVARNNLALALAIEGDTGGAERHLLDGPDSAQGLYNVGVLRMSLGRYSDAAKAFDIASAERPSMWMAARRAVQARALAATTELDHADR